MTHRRLWRSLVLINCFYLHSGFISYACLTCKHSCNIHYLIKKRKAENNSNNISNKFCHLCQRGQSPNRALGEESLRKHGEKCGQRPGARNDPWLTAGTLVLGVKEGKPASDLNELGSEPTPSTSQMNTCTHLDFILLRHAELIDHAQKGEIWGEMEAFLHYFVLGTILMGFGVCMPLRETISCKWAKKVSCGHFSLRC